MNVHVYLKITSQAHSMCVGCDWINIYMCTYLCACVYINNVTKSGVI